MTIFTKDKVSIYIHWPFCKSKCPYCDFNSHVREGVDHTRWLKALIKELDYYQDYLNGKEIISIFFGGGTPSLAHESVIAGLIDHISKKYTLSNHAEITMEANPTSSEASKFKALARAGVNRLSLGVQSLSEKYLKFLGREHSGTEARGAIDIARQNFPRYSFDLIYALPNQTIQEWKEELKNAIAIAGGHLSLYQLTIEKGTKFFAEHRAGKFKMPEDDVAADMYNLTEDVLSPYGYKLYEISNYAISGHESQHNLQYWRYGQYLGIGPGAHGRIVEAQERWSVQNISSPEEWIAKVESLGVGIQRKDMLSAEDIKRESIIMGLRTTEGIPLPRWINKDRVEALLSSGLARIDQERLFVTKEGRLLLNSIIEYLLL